MGGSTSSPQQALPPVAADAEPSVSDRHISNEGTCPVPESRRSNSPIYNVYNQRIDQPDKQSGCALNPRNNIAYGGNQPFPGQKVLLSTERVQSTIPKGGTEGTWQYPSPQMFYNGTCSTEPLLSCIFAFLCLLAEVLGLKPERMLQH